MVDKHNYCLYRRDPHRLIALRCAARGPSAERKRIFSLLTRHLRLSARCAPRRHAGLLWGYYRSSRQGGTALFCGTASFCRSACSYQTLANKNMGAPAGQVCQDVLFSCPPKGCILLTQNLVFAYTSHEFRTTESGIGGV